MDLLNLRLAAARRRLLYRPDPKLIAGANHFVRIENNFQ
jgi:hypothetical protein